MIQVCIPAKGLDSLHEKYITLKELMPIKEVRKNHPSGHYILTPGINGATIETNTQVTPQGIRSFIRGMLPQCHKHEAPLIKNWII